jgi:hypothetical protein
LAGNFATVSGAASESDAFGIPCSALLVELAFASKEAEVDFFFSLMTYLLR